MSARRFNQGRFWARLIAVTPPLIFVIWVGVYLSGVGKDFIGALPQIIAVAGGQALGREIRIGSVSASNSFNDITFYDVAVSNAPTFAQGNGRALVTAPVVEVKLSAKGLLNNPANAAAYIDSVTVTRPVAFIERFAGNKFNFSSLFKKPVKRTGKPFTGIIIAKNATVVFLDHSAPASLQPALNTISHASGDVDFSGNRLVSFNLAGSGIGVRSGNVQAFGNIASVPSTKPGFDRISGYDIHVNAANADASYWTRYFLSNLSTIGQVTGGRANVALELGQNNPAPGVPLDIVGSAIVSNAGLVVRNQKLLRAPIQNVNGKLAFTGDSLALDANATVDGMAAHVTGTVPSFKRQTLSFYADIPRINVGQLHDDLPFIPQIPAWLSVQSRPSVQVSAQGLITRPQFNVGFLAPSASIYGTPLSSIRGSIGYLGNVLTVRRLVASTPGSRDNLDVTGSVATGSAPGTLLNIRAGSVNLATLNLPQSLRKQVGNLSGIVDASAEIASGEPLTTTGHKYPIAVAARLRNASIHGLDISEAAINFATDGTNADIKRFVALQPDGAMLAVDGIAPLTSKFAQPYQLNVNVAGLNLATVGQQLHIAGLSGLSYLTSKVEGRAGDPTIRGTAHVFAGAYKTYRADQISADIAASPEEITITNGVLRRLGLTAHVNGTIFGLETHSPQVRATVTTKNAEIASITDLLQLSGAPSPKSTSVANAFQTVTGGLTAKVAVTGALNNPSVGATLTIPSGTVSGFDYENVVADASYSKGQITVSDLTGVVDGTSVMAKGLFNTKSQAIDASAHIASADLGKLAQTAGVVEPVVGSATVDAVATGTVKNPRLTLTAEIPNLQYSTVQVSVPKLVLSYADGIFDNDHQPIEIHSGPATYNIAQVVYDSHEKTVLVHSSVSGERIARLIDIAQNISSSSPQLYLALAKVPEGIDAGLSIPTLDFSGPLADPTVHTVANVSNLTLGDPKQHTINLTADVSYHHGVYNIATLEGRGPVEYISGSGTIDTHGTLDAQIEASNIPLQLLQPLIPGHELLGGDISDITAIASGTAMQPQVVGSISMSGVTVKKVTLDRIDSGKITVADGRISIAGVTFVKNEPAIGTAAPLQHVATISGSIPFVFSLQNGFKATFPTDQPVSVQADLPQQSDSLFALFAPSLASFKLGGTVQANLKLAGTLQNKLVTGSFAIKDGSAQPAGFTTAFKNINLAADFSGTHGTIESSQIESTAGGSLNLSGTVDLVSAGENIPSFANTADALLGNLTLDIKAAANNFTINEPKISALYNAGFRGTLNGNVEVANSVLTPIISGNMRISNAIGILPTVSPTEAGAQPAPTFNPTFSNIQLAILPGSQVRSAQINAQTDGNFAINGSLSQPDIVGNLYLRRGRFSFPTAIFTIQPVGTVRFVYNPPDQTTEQVYIVATTTISVSPATLAANPGGIQGTDVTSYNPAAFTGQSSSATFGGQSTRYQITVTISGDLSAPNGLNLTFQSSPPGLTSAQILAAVGGQQAINALLVNGNVSNALQAEATQIFTNYAIPTLLQPLESSVASAFGLEDFSVNYDTQTPLLVSVTKALGPRLDVRYERYFSSRTPGAVANTLQPLQYQVSLDYNLTNRFRVYASTDDQQNYTYGVDGVVNF